MKASAVMMKRMKGGALMTARANTGPASTIVGHLGDITRDMARDIVVVIALIIIELLCVIVIIVMLCVYSLARGGTGSVGGVIVIIQ